MSQRHILVVDDELINLEIIREYLEDAGYDLELVQSGDAAWQVLTSSVRPFDVAILDRMMPGISGIELLRKMKADARFTAIPVIMQTAATAPEQVREGIEAGAYYYLAKPYEPETLSAIMRAAIADIDERIEANRHAAAHVRAMEMLDQAEFRFRTLEEVGALIEVLSSLCPAPQLAATGLSELLVNAVEHGNLGISYAEKKRLRLDDAWEGEVARRLALPEHADKAVRIRVERHADRIEFRVQDQGPGFNWEHYLAIDPDRAADPNGRGIALARMLSFASLQYEGCGNIVTVTVRTDPAVS